MLLLDLLLVAALALVVPAALSFALTRGVFKVIDLANTGGASRRAAPAPALTAAKEPVSVR